MMAISVTGYAPNNLNYCPECGAKHFPNTTYFNGKMECDNCGLTCFIVEADDSHSDKQGGDGE